MSFNQAIVVGNLGNDPDAAFTQGGTAVTKFNVATTEKRKDRDGNRKEVTTWHRVTAFGKLGEICGEYLAKGSKVMVVGRIHNDSYEKDGVKHYTSEIIASEMRMLGDKPSGERAPRTEQPRRQAPTNPAADDFVDDEIPF